MDAETNHRLPRTVTPLRYDLTLEPDLESATFVGSEEVAIRVRERVDEVVLNAADLGFLAGWIEVAGGRRIEVREAFADAEAERWRLSLAESIEPGEALLHVEFHGRLNDKLRGFYRSTYTDDDGSEHVIAATQFEATDARLAFPCWDEPDLKAVFGVTLVVRDGLTALSNGPEAGREALDDGRVRVRFVDTMVMSTYLVAFVVGRLELTGPVEAEGVPIRVAHVPGKGHLAGFALEVAAFSIRFLTDYYGIPYPDRKVDLVALPDFAQGAMENVGCVTFREALLLVDPSTATQQELVNIADVVAHELAHMWFGDLVTMRWWNGIWLNEAFATFMALLVVDAYRPDWERWASFGRGRSVALDIDALESTRAIEYPVHSPDDARSMFDPLTYQKGASVLRMLERYLGPEAFREGIRRYLKRHAYGNTETGDLWDALEEATGEPARRIMDSWIFQGGYPLVTVTVGLDTVHLAQEGFRYGRVGDGAWDVPLLVRQVAGAAQTEDPVLVEPGGTSLALVEPGAVVVANAGGGAFVRVGYDASLSERLHRSVFEVLAPIERYQLVDDMWASVVAGRARVGEFLRMARAFAGESDLHVWGAILVGLGWCDRLLEGEPREAYRRFIRSLTGPALERLGWEPRPGDDDLMRALRGSLLSALGVLGADANARALARELEAESRSGEHVDPALAAAAVSTLAATGTLEDFDRYLVSKDEAATPQEKLRYLYALADFRGQDAMERLLPLTLTDAIRPQDAPFVLGRALGNRDQGDHAWRFLRERWNEAIERFPESSIIWMVDSVRFLTREEQPDEVDRFFAEHPVPQAGKMLDQVLERQRVGAALRRRAAPELAAAFSPGGAFAG